MSNQEAALGAAPAPSLVGEVLDGRYRITHKIGEGGMGEVYAAEHVHIEKKLAIKLLKQEIISNAEAVTRFRQEARSASSIGHRNIIGIEDFGQLPDGRIYMCMELLQGTPLNDLIKTAQPLDRLLNILIQTGHGLAAAHAKGIVHRDMKPENIFVTRAANGEDVPKLLDFGIAKVAGHEGGNHLTRTGTIFGTPFYMAPEQALGNPVDARTDIYAVGVILYEVFAGSVPFGGESFMGILTQHITAEPEPVAQRAAAAGRVLPPGMAEIIGYCMQKNPGSRYQSMDDLVNALVLVYRQLAGAGMSSYMEAFPLPGQSVASGASAMVSSNLAPGSYPPSATPPNPLSGAPTGGMAAPGAASGMAAPGYAGASQPNPAFAPPNYSAVTPGSGMPSAAPGAAASAANWTGTSAGNAASSSFVAPKRSKLPIVVAALLLVGGGGAAAWYFGAGPGKSNDTASQAGAGSTGAGSTGAGSANLTADAATVPSGSQTDPWQGGSAAQGSATAGVVVDAAPSEPARAPDAAPAVVATMVTVRAKSGAFEIFDGDLQVGSSGDAIEVVGAGSRKLTLRANGYKNLNVEISAAKSEWVFALEKKRGSSSVGNGKPPTGNGTPPTGNGNTGTNNTNPTSGEKPDKPTGPDCRNRIVDSKSKACVALYCRTHPDSDLCGLE